MPVRRAVYGTIALVLTAFILAVVAFFIPVVRNETVISGSNQAQQPTSSSSANAKATADGKTSEQSAVDGEINSLPKVTP